MMHALSVQLQNFHQHKMKQLEISIFLCFLIGLATAISTEDMKSTTLEVKQKLKSVLSDEDNPFFAYENATATIDGFCSGFTNNIEAEFDKSIDCVANITLGDKTMCQVIQTQVSDCFENVIVFLEGCLEAPGNQLPRLLLQIGKSVTRYLCQTTGEQQLELFNPCLYEDTDFSKRFDESVLEDKEKFDVDNFKLPSKQDICKEFLEAKDLLTSHITTACTGQITKESAIGFINALFEPCKTSEAGNTNNAV